MRTLHEKFPDLQQGDVESALNCILGQMTDALVFGDNYPVRSGDNYLDRLTDM